MLFNSMESCGVKPNAITYNAAISSCEKGGQWEKALVLFNSIRVAASIARCHHLLPEEEQRCHRGAGLRGSMEYIFSKAFSSSNKFDLHDSSAAVARPIMRVVLSEWASWAKMPGGIAVITGWGKHSKDEPLLSFLGDIATSS